MAETWSEIDKAIFALCIPTQWDMRGVDTLRQDTSYLCISNHQTWVDIPALIESLNRRTPFFKFFLKKELIWVPLLGLAWWGLDYPFMKRYSKAFLDKHPELKGKDLEITKAACELFKRQPVTVVNYLEGTRFTEAKRPAAVALPPPAQTQGRRRGVCAGGAGRAAGCVAGRDHRLSGQQGPGVLGPAQRQHQPGDHRHSRA
jgi:1-acyl-sn-glycerol-3-phosphate acyltransferase